MDAGPGERGSPSARRRALRDRGRAPQRRRAAPPALPLPASRGAPLLNCSDGDAPDLRRRKRPARRTARRSRASRRGSAGPRSRGARRSASAACSAAPHDMPASSPGAARAGPRRADRVVVADRDHLVEQRTVEHRRHEARADALDAVRAGTARPRAPASRRARPRRRAAAGCSRSRRYSPTPVIVPPVPTPATRTSTSPSSARAISGPVVRRWACGFAGFENWSGRNTSLAGGQRTRRLRPPRPSPPSTRSPATRAP